MRTRLKRCARPCVADAAASAFKNLVPDTATPLPDLQDTSQEAVQLVPPEFTGKVWDYIEDQVLAQSQGGDRCRRRADRHPRRLRPGARGSRWVESFCQVREIFRSVPWGQLPTTPIRTTYNCPSSSRRRLGIPPACRGPWSACTSPDLFADHLVISADFHRSMDELFAPYGPSSTPRSKDSSGPMPSARTRTTGTPTSPTPSHLKEIPRVSLLVKDNNNLERGLATAVAPSKATGGARTEEPGSSRSSSSKGDA